MSTEIILGILGLAGTIAASLVTYFLTNKKNDAEVDNLKAEAERHRLETEKIRRELYPSQPGDQKSPQPVRELGILASERAELTKYYREQINAATAIDIITISMQALFENYGKEKFIEWVQAGKKIRILVLSPLSVAAKLRSHEEGYEENHIPTKILTQIETLAKLYGEANTQLAEKEYSGSLEVRFYDGIPHFAVFHTENTLAIGLYYSHIKGLQSEVLEISPKSTLYEKVCAHFEHLWGKRDQASIVCVISNHSQQMLDLTALRASVLPAGK